MRRLSFALALTALPAVWAGAAPDSHWGKFFDGSALRPELQHALPTAVSTAAKTAIDPRVPLMIAADAANAKDPVWPGYAVLGQPLLVYEADQRSYLIGHPNPPPGYNISQTSPKTVYEKAGAIPDLQFTFQFHRQVNGVDTFAYRHETGSNAESDVHTIVHERFHVHQEDAFKRVHKPRRTSEVDAEDLTLAGLEQALLKDAINASDPLTASDYARQYLAVRAERYRLHPDCKGQEDDEERFEGMAEYVETGLLERQGLLLKRGPVVEYSIKLARFPEIDDMDKGRYYGTGAAQGLLLDRAGPKDWKQRVQGGTGPHDVLALTYPIKGTEAALLAKAKSRSDYAALSQLGTKKAAEFQQQKAQAIAEYAAQKGREWTIEVPWTQETQFGHSSGKPEFEVGKNERLMPHMRTVDVRSDGFALHAEERPAVIGAGVRLYAAMSAVVMLDGKPFVWADGTYPFKSLTVSELGFELSITKPGTLTVAGKTAKTSTP